MSESIKRLLLILLFLQMAIEISDVKASLGNTENHQLFVPYIGPYLTLIIPEFSDKYQTPTILNSASNIVINYEIKNVPSYFVAKVYYRMSGESNWNVQNEDKNKEHNRSSDKDIKWGKVHHITLRNLKPKTKYEYKVLGLNKQVSAQYHFTTTDLNSHSSRFLVIGDMQDENRGQRWQEIVNIISEKHMEDFDFIINVGDMAKDDISENGDRFYWWKVFFNKGQNLLAYKAMLPSLGNHDTPASKVARSNTHCLKVNTDYFKAYCSNADDSRSFRKYFNIHPNNYYPNYFSFKQGSACFISANTEIPIFYGRYPELDTAKYEERHQQWLEAKIKQHKSCTWSFVYQHIPVINASNNKEYEINYIRHYSELYNGNIDWSFSGHTHQYQRMNPLYLTSDLINVYDNYGRGNSQGVGYLIAAPAGQWPRNDSIERLNIVSMYPHNDSGEEAYEIGFTIINTDYKSMHLASYGMGSVGEQVQPKRYRENNDRSNILLDSLSYTKD